MTCPNDWLWTIRGEIQSQGLKSLARILSANEEWRIDFSPSQAFILHPHSLMRLLIRGKFQAFILSNIRRDSYRNKSSLIIILDEFQELSPLLFMLPFSLLLIRDATEVPSITYKLSPASHPDLQVPTGTNSDQVIRINKKACNTTQTLSRCIKCIIG